MNIVTLDVETTISNNGHFADKTNKLVAIGIKKMGQSAIVLSGMYPDRVNFILKNQDLIVGFNIKFDLHWLRKAGVNLNNIRVWDCQLAEFLLESQSNPYNSLNDACIKYGLDTKLDVVKTEYWDKGIDTDKIPPDILEEYLRQDLSLTEQVMIKQMEEFKNRHPNLLKLFKLQCRDLLVLEDIEYNGIKFNTTKAREAASELDSKLIGIYNSILDIVGNYPINLNSNDHLSAILYGGVITEATKQPNGVFKTGARAGQIKYKNVDVEHKLERLIEPLKNTETAKSKKLKEAGLTTQETFWEVNTDVIRQLKPTGKAKKVIELLLEYSKLEKLKGTYLLGWSDLIDKMNWKKDMIYGNLNQCVVVTGRLSSTKPNMQNVDKYTKKFMESRYDN